MAAACAAMCGCRNDGTARPITLSELFAPPGGAATATAPAGAPAEPVAGAPAQPAPPAVLQISFDVLRTQVSRGTFSESGKVWNHIDEQVIPADLAATLQRNGLRVGRGKLASWRPIKAILDAEQGVLVFQNSMTMYNGLPLGLELDLNAHDQTVFLFRRDGTLGGVTLPLSMNLIRLEYSVPVAQPDSVMVEIMPEVRLQEDEPRLTVNGWAGQQVVPRSRVFRELSARLLIGPDEFLALGPSVAAQQAHSVGAALLCREVNGVPTESMFFITPRVVRKQYSPALVPSGGQAQAPARGASGGP